MQSSDSVASAAAAVVAEQIPDTAQCCICKNLAYPCYTCKDTTAHLLCEACVLRVDDLHTCPVCRERVTFVPCAAFEKLAEALFPGAIREYENTPRIFKPSALPKTSIKSATIHDKTLDVATISVFIEVVLRALRVQGKRSPSVPDGYLLIPPGNGIIVGCKTTDFVCVMSIDTGHYQGPYKFFRFPMLPAPSPKAAPDDAAVPASQGKKRKSASAASAEGQARARPRNRESPQQAAAIVVD